MSEKSMYTRVMRALRPLDGLRVENPTHPGTPDINYMEGWIECKWLRKWPVNSSTPVTIEHFTNQQRIWLRRRWERGGHAYLLLNVKGEWLLFDGATASEHVGRVNRAQLHQLVWKAWGSRDGRGLYDKEFRECLTTKRVLVA